MKSVHNSREKKKTSTGFKKPGLLNDEGSRARWKNGSCAVEGLKCYSNGEFKILPFHEAHKLLWEVGFGWVVPADWCRYRIGTVEGERLLSPSVLRSTKEYLLLTLSRRTPISWSDFVERFPQLEEGKENTFSQRAHRVKAIFGVGREEPHPLLQYVPLVFPSGSHEPAYRVRPNITTLVILELAEHGLGAGQDVLCDLLTPPRSSSGE